MHSQWHSATHTTLSLPIPTNHNGTALPTGRPPHQSQRHSATHTTTNPTGTAPPTQHSAAHATDSATHTTRPPPIPMDTTGPPPSPTAQRIGHDMPTTNPHGTAHRTRHAHHQSLRHNEVTLPPNNLDTSQSRGHSRTAHQAHRERGRTCAVQFHEHTLPPPAPPFKNKVTRR